METNLDGYYRLHRVRRFSSIVGLTLFFLVIVTLTACDLTGRANREAYSFNGASFKLEERADAVENAEQVYRTDGTTPSLRIKKESDHDANAADFDEVGISTNRGIRRVEGESTVSIEKIPAMKVELLSGVPGTSRDRARGIGNKSSEAKPLYVVDGTPVSDLDMISSSNIGSFDVLNASAATAMYGKRGMNGVVQVTTKRERDGNIRELAAVFGATWVVLSGAN